MSNRTVVMAVSGISKRAGSDTVEQRDPLGGMKRQMPAATLHGLSTLLIRYAT